MIVLARYRRWKSLFVALAACIVAAVFASCAPLWASAEYATGRGSGWIKLFGAIPGIIYFTYAFAVFLVYIAVRLAWFGIGNVAALTASPDGLLVTTFKGSQAIAWRSIQRVSLEAYAKRTGGTTDPKFIVHFIDDASGASRARGVMTDVLDIYAGSPEGLADEIESLAHRYLRVKRPQPQAGPMPPPASGFGRRGL